MHPTVLVVDDSPPVRRAIRLLIENNTDWQICAEAENGYRAVELAEELAPSVVILDLAMPVMNGLAAARQISKIAPSSVMVMYTLFANEQLAKEAQAVGIRGVVSKGDAADLLTLVRSFLPSTAASSRSSAKSRNDSAVRGPYDAVLNPSDGSLVE
jgi:DNA-binding NarL/FixJ family response regulator